MRHTAEERNLQTWHAPRYEELQVGIRSFCGSYDFRAAFDQRYISNVPIEKLTGITKASCVKAAWSFTAPVRVYGRLFSLMSVIHVLSRDKFYRGGVQVIHCADDFDAAFAF